MIQVKDYKNLVLPYTINIPPNFWDEWWAVRLKDYEGSRSELDDWCMSHIGWSHADFLTQSDWFRYVGSELWLFKDKRHALIFLLKNGCN